MEKVTLWDFIGHGLRFSIHPHSSLERSVPLSTFPLFTQTDRIDPSLTYSGLC